MTENEGLLMKRRGWVYFQSVTWLWLSSLVRLWGNRKGEAVACSEHVLCHCLKTEYWSSTCSSCQQNTEHIRQMDAVWNKGNLSLTQGYKTTRCCGQFHILHHTADWPPTQLVLAFQDLIQAILLDLSCLLCGTGKVTSVSLILGRRLYF